MSLDEMKNLAFAKWLNQQPPDVAAQHVFECLRDGPSDNMAWDLMAAAHGNGFAVTPATVFAAVDALREKETA